MNLVTFCSNFKDIITLFSKMKIIILFSMIGSVLSSDCKQETGSGKECQCKTKEGFVVDLSKLSDITNLPGSPTDSVYNISACDKLKPTQPPKCLNASICQTSSGMSYDLGRPITAGSNPFSGDPWKDTLTVKYTGGADGRVSDIILKCKENGKEEWSVQAESPPKNYHFTVKTPIVCQPQKSKRLSTGSILCIILLVVVLVYIIGGVLYMRYFRGARGVEQIPNLAFWRELPLLIWDGVVFLKNGCKTDSTYDQI